MLIGAILGLISFPAIWLAFGEPRLASAVALSVFAAGTVANGIGLLFPWLLKRLRFDPAYGTGPASTVVQDVCTILIYFGIVGLFAL